MATVRQKIKKRIDGWIDTVQRRRREEKRRRKAVQAFRRQEADKTKTVRRLRRRTVDAIKAKSPEAKVLSDRYHRAQQDLQVIRNNLDNAEEDLLYTRKEREDAEKELAELRKKLTGDVGERAWQIAGHLVGIMEKGGNNRGPMVSRIIRENNGIVGEPWCGDFVAYCYRHAGSHTVTREWASAWGIEDAPGISITGSPRTGDPVNFKFGEGHIGLFGKHTASNEILTREGNTGASGAVSDSKLGGDGVYEKKRPTGVVRHYLKVKD